MPFVRFDRPGDYIGGAFAPVTTPDGELRPTSPADTADEIGVFRYSAAHVDDAVSAARGAFGAWRRLGAARRAELLQAYKARLAANADGLAETITREVGKPTWEARGEVQAMMTKVDLTLGEGTEWTRNRTIADLPGEIRYRPHGVMAVVGPFNFPGHLPNGHFVPALALGNTVVLKPSDKAPGVATWIARSFHEAGFPAGVFNMIQGDAEVASKLVGHPDIDGVLFTGSVAVGESIAVANARRFERIVALELGGKNASLVLADADVDRAAREIAFAGFVTAGQRCTATSRVFVERRIFDAFIARVRDVAERVRVGYPFDADVFLGPMVSASSRDALFAAQSGARIAGFSAIVEGGTVQVPGRPGYYVKPSLHLAPSLSVSAPAYEHAELFGPDLALYAFDRVEDAYEAINATPYGLGGAVFTSQRERFEEAADVLRLGVLHWNRSSAGASSRLPFGGVKRSGNHHPASIAAGTSCAYPLALFLAPPKDAPLATWPGFPAGHAGTSA